MGDVRLYLALNGALHDAAIGACRIKGHCDYVRPIAAIRRMAELGQSSDPKLRCPIKNSEEQSIGG